MNYCLVINSYAAIMLSKKLSGDFKILFNVQNFLNSWCAHGGGAV